MLSTISPCGIQCTMCPFFEKSCEGCQKVKGKPFWTAEHMGGNACPLYDCGVNEKGFGSCAPCPELPCKMFRDMKDPNSSEEEHREGIEKRVRLLKETLE